ncbi:MULTISPECIES: hypothetical protein [Burkholderia]|nr:MULTISPECIES: hypothetical protein [Burkholderia]
MCLADWPPADAAGFCRSTMVSDAQAWHDAHPDTTDRLHFCITIGDAH